MRGIASLAGASALALGLSALAPAAQAAVISTSLARTLTGSPLTISLGGGAATLSFTADTTSFAPAASVATGGSGMVTTIFGGIADFGAGAVINNDPTNLLYTFAAYPTATSIPNSQADDFIGFSYGSGSTLHYGYAEVFGSSLVGYAFESTANTAITTASVPEPAPAALVMAGMVGIGLVRRRKKAGGVQAA